MYTLDEGGYERQWCDPVPSWILLLWPRRHTVCGGM